ncbi:MAG: glycosyltransferase family 2 protein [Deltaproteobacteria bacterium]|nr:glycosyltransferase family 2 protein [Deltaproteobacteria bacterium]
MFTKKHHISLSVFFPCFNEALNIEDLVLEATEILDNLVQEYEILIINDGSTDNTGLVTEKLAVKHKNVRVIHHQKNRGYGAALISGFSSSAHEWIFFTDGDHQFHMHEIEMLLKEIDHYDLILGFRKKRQDPWHRTLYAWSWNRLVRILFSLKIRDLNCAFKLIRKKALEGISLNSSGATISTELLVKMKLSGAHIKQVGVSHIPRRFGTQTGSNLKVILKAFVELFLLYKESKLRS